MSSNQSGSAFVLALGLTAIVGVTIVSLSQIQQAGSAAVLSKVVETTDRRALSNLALQLGSALRGGGSAPTDFGCGATGMSKALSTVAGYATETGTYLTCVSVGPDYVLKVERKPSASAPPTNVLGVRVSGAATCDATTGPTNPAQFGNGTKASPYQICTAAQLDAIRSGYFDKYFVLTSNIDLSVLSIVAGSNFHQIMQLAGLDGGGHSISNLKLTDTTGKASMIGAVAASSSGAIVHDLSLLNYDIQSNWDGTSSTPDGGWAGGVVGMGGNMGVPSVAVLQRITATGSLKVTLNLGLYNSVQAIGGIAAEINGCDDCRSQVAISVTLNQSPLPPRSTSSVNVGVGGIAGHAFDNQFNRSQSTGSIQVFSENKPVNSLLVGGLVGYGYQSCDVLNSMSRSDITVAGPINYITAGGLIGGCGGGPPGTYVGLNKTYTAGKILMPPGPEHKAGALIALDLSGSSISAYWDATRMGALPATARGITVGTQPLNTAQMAVPASFVDWDFTTVWKMSGGFPVLQ